LLPDRIRIIREGWLAHLYDQHSRTELLLQQIRSLEFKCVLAGMGGYLAFHDDAGLEAMEDLCVSFLKPQKPSFEAISNAIEQRCAAIRADHKNDLRILREEQAF